MEKDVGKNLDETFLTQKYPELLDHRNSDLWDYLKGKYKFELKESPEPGYLTYFDHNRVVIEVDVQELSPAAFTHELLHVFLKSEGLEIVWDFRKRVIEDQELQDIFSTSLRVHIGNCLEHIKMLPMFLALGFVREEFLRDYHKKLVEMEEISSLSETYFRNNKVVPESSDRFMGDFFAIKATANLDFNYEPLLENLQKIDPFLFSILDKFWQAWLNFHLGDPKVKYLIILDNFLDEIKTWKRNWIE